MTPWQLAATSEHSHQRAFFAWANCAAKFGFDIADDVRGYSLATRNEMPDSFAFPVPALAFMFAIPNGGKRDQITAGKLKAEGVKPGVPDVMLPVARWMGALCAGLFLEFKKPSERPKREGAGGVAAKQTDYHEFLIGQGYRVVVVYSWEDARQAVIDYLR